MGGPLPPPQRHLCASPAPPERGPAAPDGPGLRRGQDGCALQARLQVTEQVSLLRRWADAVLVAHRFRAHVPCSAWTQELPAPEIDAQRGHRASQDPGVLRAPVRDAGDRSGQTLLRRH